MTAELVRATLQRLSRVQQGKKDAPPTVRADGDAISVQLNPSTLKITRRNNVDRGGVTTGTQKAQHPAQEGATLSFDLEFDTSEQGSRGEHVDVRQWTALVRQFVEPDKKKKPAEAPPAVRFSWGRLIFTGIVDQVTEDLDLFASDGTALHAKVSLSISEQDFDFESMETGNGSRDQRAASDPGAPTGAAPGQSGTRNPQNVVQAHDGESAQQLLSRLGQDPAAWRAAMTGLDSPLGLGAGAAVTLGLEVTGGLTGAVGSGGSQFAASPTAATPAALAAALGLPTPPGSDGPGAPTPAVGAPPASRGGFELAAAGGLARAERIVQAEATSGAVRRSAEAFAVPPGTGRAAPDPDEPLDQRALTYGQAIPLQRRAQAVTAAQATLGGSSAVAARAPAGELTASGPGAPPWVRLPGTGSAAAGCDTQRRWGDAAAPILRWRPGGGMR